MRGLCSKLADTLALPGDAAPPEQQPRFAAVSRHEAILWDYRTTSHSPRGHPLEAVRSELRRRRLPTAEDVRSARDGARIRYVGLVICRQRPGSASGVTFYTLEDETGTLNAVVWRQVFERHTVLAKTALLLGISGRVQNQDGVVHLIADELFEPELTLQPHATSRDFH